jgi:hypothetical protein
MLPVHIDSASQKYVDVANVRITVKAAGWAGASRHVSIRAYTGVGGALMMGPELAITTPITTLDDDLLLQTIGAVLTLLTS